MEVKGIDFSIFIAFGLIIILLNLYGPFTLLFFLPVPFYLFLIIVFQSFQYQNRKLISRIIPQLLHIRGPPQTIFSP
jgi:ABC-type multidrug transport system fused ATPase/permease subunit